jgi:phosphoglucomutase
MAFTDPAILEKAHQWLDSKFDEETRKQVRNMIDNDPVALTDAFYRSLEFGTGGMRGKMAPGTNRMNVYTVGMATQGLANYLKKMFTGMNSIRVVISYDSRINNKLFANTVADVLSANGIKVFIFESLRPTPELSFAIRQMCCQSGIMVTASHNPKEYNGYKVYWNDGGQLVPPHDNNVIAEVEKIAGINDVKFEGNPDLIETIYESMDHMFLLEVKKLLFLPELTTKDKISIVYTPLHGTGGRLIPKALQSFGYTNLHLVEEQMIEDGNFPTAKSPNPEEAVALELAIMKAKKVNADLVMATDPDADRIGIAIKDDLENYILLNGNQTGALLMDYVLGKWKEKNQIRENNFVVTTIVTSEIMKAIAGAYNVKIYDVLTGFKWIADVIRVKEGKEKYIIGLEESYGYMISDFVRDKDSVSAAVLIAEIAAEAASNNKGVFDLLIDVYLKYGFYKEGLISINKEGKSGAEEISKMMSDYRKNPPAEIDHKKVVRIMDYDHLISKDLLTGKTTKIDLPASNVLQFFTEDGSKISVRPSGTEPKIKFYFSVKEHLASKSDYAVVNKKLDEKIENMMKSLGLK